MAKKGYKRKRTKEIPRSLPKRQDPKPSSKVPSKNDLSPSLVQSKREMSPRVKLIIFLMMGTLVLLLVGIAIIAPDSSRGNQLPDSTTILWRLVFLLVPTFVMFTLLGMDWLKDIFKRFVSRRP